jgi:hypothetical protein
MLRRLTVIWSILGPSQWSLPWTTKPRFVATQNILKYFVRLWGLSGCSFPTFWHVACWKELCFAPAAQPPHQKQPLVLCSRSIHSQSIQHLHPTFPILVPLLGPFSPCDTTSSLRQIKLIYYPARFGVDLFSAAAQPRHTQVASVLGPGLPTHYSPYPKLLL